MNLWSTLHTTELWSLMILISVANYSKLIMTHHSPFTEAVMKPMSPSPMITIGEAWPNMLKTRFDDAPCASVSKHLTHNMDQCKFFFTSILSIPLA